MTVKDQPRTRVHWWRVTMDLQAQGYSLAAISDNALIPLSTLMGYRNLDAEPKHYDGESLLAFWRRVMPPGSSPPTQPPRLFRQRELSRR